MAALYPVLERGLTNYQACMHDAIWHIALVRIKKYRKSFRGLWQSTAVFTSTVERLLLDSHSQHSSLFEGVICIVE